MDRCIYYENSSLNLTEKGDTIMKNEPGSIENIKKNELEDEKIEKIEVRNIKNELSDKCERREENLKKEER